MSKNLIVGVHFLALYSKGEDSSKEKTQKKKEMWFWILVKGVLLHRAVYQQNNKDFIPLMCMQVGNVLQ
jgi:hypothetical protein